jgi:broad specificity phosphatase PhoE
VLILVRHGQTASNAEGRLLGRGDPPLTELGARQAAAVADAIGSVDRVVASPLLRAQQTAAAFGTTIETDNRWIEIDYGELEGQPLSAMGGDFWARWRADASLTPPGGESLVDVGARVRAACEALTDDARERDVVVVSHVSPIKAAVAWALGGDERMAWRMFLDVAAVSRIIIRDHGPVLATYGESVG